MILKIPVYFQIEREDASSKLDPEILKRSVQDEVHDVLQHYDFKLEGSFWSSNRVTAKYLSIDQVHEILRTKS